MFPDLPGLGVASPVVGLLLIGLALACVAATLTARRFAQKREERRRAAVLFVWPVVWLGIFLLWGTLFGGGGAAPGSEQSGLVQASLLRYLTITSQQAAVDQNWTHDLSLHFLPLLGTVFLTLVIWVVPAFAGRRSE